MENQKVQGQPPKTWLVESILVTLFCCLPFGIIGIINAAKVESKFFAGAVDESLRASEDAAKVESRFFAGAVDEALRASQDAAKWTKIGFFVGLGWIVLVIILYAIMGAAMLAVFGAAAVTH